LKKIYNGEDYDDLM